MAQVKYSGPVAAVSGKIGGTVYGRNRYGAYARLWAKPVNPRTDKQEDVRGRLANASVSYGGLTQTQKDNWASYAAATPRQNRVGDTVFYSGFNWYVSNYVAAQTVGITPSAEAPETPGMLPKPVVNAISVTSDGQTQITTGGGFINGIPNGQISLYRSVPLGGGVAYYQGPWILVGTVQGDDETPPALEWTDSAEYAVGQYYAFKITQYDPNVYKQSPYTFVQPVAVAAI